MKWMLLLAALLASADETLINSVQKERLESQRELSDLQSRLTRQSWIGAPELFARGGKSGARGGLINYQYDVKGIGARWEQDLFRSGGIWYEFESADRQKILDTTELNIREKVLRARIYDLTLQIRQEALRVQKIRLHIENKDEERRHKEEKFKNGLIDISELDRTLIELKFLHNEQAVHRAEKQSLESALKRFTDRTEPTIEIPDMAWLHRATFLKRNSAIEAQAQRAALSETDTKRTWSNYLPRVSVYGEYQRENDLNNFEAFGKALQNTWRAEVVVSMPIDVNAFDDVERARVLELVSRLDVSDTQMKETAFYDNLDARLELLATKIQNAKEVIKYYRELHDHVDSLVKNGLSNGIECRSIANTIHINEIDRDILQMDKTRLLLALHASTLSRDFQ